MKNKAKLLLILTFSLLTAFLQAQTSKVFPDNLKKMSMQDVMSLGNDAMKDIPVYDLKGKLIDEDNPQPEGWEMDYGRDYFADANGKLVAMKLRELTEQERGFITRFKEMQAKLAALIGTPAKQFETVDMEGNSVSLEDMKGSVVAINFWFIGCKPCIMEMPELNEIVSHFEGENVKFLAIALDSKEQLAKFANEKTFDYNVIPKGKELATLYEVSGYPTHCIVDQEGNIAYFKSAYSPQTASELTATIENLLKK